MKDWIIAVNYSYQFIEIVIFHYNNPYVSLHVRIFDTVWRRNFREVRSQIAHNVLVTENMNLEKFIERAYFWIFGPRDFQDQGIHSDLATLFCSNLHMGNLNLAFYRGEVAGRKKCGSCRMRRCTSFIRVSGLA